MSSKCNGICQRDISTQFLLGYNKGQKYCSTCQRYFLTENFRCPCCKQDFKKDKKLFDKHLKECAKGTGSLILNAIDETIKNHITKPITEDK